MKFQLVTLGFVAALSFGCGTDKKDSKKEDSSPATTVSFASVNTNVFKKSCHSCHTKATGNSGNINLETYAEAYKNRAGIYSSAITAKTMPQTGSLTAAQLSELKAWLDAGAPQ